MPIANRNLTAHFTLHELLTSETAVRFQFNEQFEPSPQIVKNLELLCQNVLEPLRMGLNMPLRVNSGYRCIRVNSLVGGASKSQHLLGQAADIVVLNPAVSVEELFQRARAMKLPFDQIIQEFNSWVHISFRANPRGEVLRATKTPLGKTVYQRVDTAPLPIQ
ncbi:peptidase M15A [Fibrisoma limi BUZ 3]|uniref:Peptidase M15A n=1 Tax=Fibrisoma limi BUZ 3 TaxID=1185876 RepID=I2GT73_9BACT|nr:D-Ala-D-Ala carboxypeptidase family metallohydrolase [Fibrisoma limi]CCH57102.1 peptidase M15A [Fibrisoma limi BUZ 3]